MNEKMKIVVLDGFAGNPGDLSWAPLEALGQCTVYDRTAPQQVYCMWFLCKGLPYGCTTDSKGRVINSPLLLSLFSISPKPSQYSLPIDVGIFVALPIVFYVVLLSSLEDPRQEILHGACPLRGRLAH